MFCKKGVLRNFVKFIGKHPCQRLFFNQVAEACNFIKIECLAQVFPCELCEVSKNIFFYRTAPVAASYIQFHKIQKRPLKVFCEKRCFKKFRKTHRNTLYAEHLRTTASENIKVIAKAFVVLLVLVFFPEKIANVQEEK